jgi:hypothetical protein
MDTCDALETVFLPENASISSLSGSARYTLASPATGVISSWRKIMFSQGITPLRSRPSSLEEEHHAVAEATPYAPTVNPGNGDDHSDGVSVGVADIARDLAGTAALAFVGREVGLLCAGPIGALIGWGIGTGLGTVLACADVDREKGHFWFYEPTDTS